MNSSEIDGSPTQGSTTDANGATNEGLSRNDLASLSQPTLYETGPPQGTRKALGVAAEVILRQGKHVLDMAVRVTAHQALDLSWDAILDPGDIRRVLLAVGDSLAYPRSQLVLMASNTMETLPLAREIRKRFIDELDGEVCPPTPGSEAWKLAAPESPLNHLLTILSKIESGHLEEAERMILAAVESDPSFNHPVIADFMCSRLLDRDEGTEKLRQWLRSALHFRPLDLRMIELLIAIEDPQTQELLAQLKSVAIESHRKCQER